MTTADERALAALPPGAAPTDDYLRKVWYWIMLVYAYRYDWQNESLDRSARERRNLGEHWRSMLPEIIRLHEGGELVEDAVLGDCEDTACTLLDIAVLLGVPQDRCVIHRVAALPETQTIDHALAEVNGRCYDIYTPAPHHPYQRGGWSSPAHRWVDHQVIPIRPDSWLPTT